MIPFLVAGSARRRGRSRWRDPREYAGARRATAGQTALRLSFLEAEIAHFVGMGLQTTPEVIVATVEAPGMDLAVASHLASSVRRPALVIHGDSDAITSTQRGIELARLANAELVVLAGSGHEPQCRIPGHVNDLLDHFLAKNLSQVVKG